MKIKDTVIRGELKMVISGERETCGIFTYIFTDTEGNLYNYRRELTVEYYTSWSANKNTSATYDNIYELFSNETPSANNYIGNIIKTKFLQKWEKLYNDFNLSYDVLNNESFTESTSRVDNTNNTFEKTIENTEEQASKSTTNSEYNNTNYTFGYNSTNPVPTDQSNSTENSNSYGNAEDNTFNQNKSENSSEDKDYTSNKIYQKNGRNESGSKMLEKEIMFRNKYILFNIIYRDIDSILATLVY